MVANNKDCYLPHKISPEAFNKETARVRDLINTGIDDLVDDNYQGPIPSRPNTPSSHVNTEFEESVGGIDSDTNIDSEIIFIVSFPLLRLVYYC